MAYRVFFTRRFVAGNLIGLTHTDSLPFPNKPLAIGWIASMEDRRIRSSSDYVVTDCRIVRARDEVAA